ncbi:MAG: T9SS type A sorting domain-containing protein [Ignavibacteriaceae bacterium]
MFKSILFLIFILGTLNLFGQNDPLKWSAPIKGNSNNIFLIWCQNSNNSTASYQKDYSYVLGNGLPIDKRFVSRSNHSDSIEVYGSKQMDAAAGYFKSSVFENVVAAWEGPNQTIQITIPHFDSTKNMWSESSRLTVQGPLANLADGLPSRIFVRTGDFLGNGKDQFVLAFQGADSTIHIQIYNVDNNLEPHLVASANDEKLIGSNSALSRFSISAGDLNGDGKDELILNGFEQNFLGSGLWDIYSQIYEVDNNNIIAKARKVIISEPYYSVTGINFASTAGKFKLDGTDQIGFACNLIQDNNDNHTFLYMLEATHDLNSLTYDSSKVVSLHSSSTLSQGLSLTSGDLNNDGRDELVFALGVNLHVYSSDDSLNLLNPFNLNFFGFVNPLTTDQSSYDYLKIGDINEDGKNEIVAAEQFNDISTGNHNIELIAYTLSKELTSDSTVAEIVDESEFYNNNDYHYAIALGNFDGHSFTVGQPKHFSVSNIVQPLVILNSPPIHFDILNGIKYDLNNCFNGQDCTFYSTYQKTSSHSVEVSSQIHNSYGVGAGIDAEGQISYAPEGIGVSTNYTFLLESKLGEDYTNSSTNSKTVTISVGVTAEEDDQIYATISSYDLWQYPVFNGTDPTPYNYLLIMEPTSIHGQWFPSKSYSVNDYIPNHEIGNVLSYAEYDSLNNNPDIVQNIQPVYQAPSFTVGASGGSDWGLTFSDFSKYEADTAWTIGFNFKSNNGLLLAEANYENSNISTQAETISSGIDLHSYLGKLVDSLGGEASYSVTPYAYRSKNGALVINYAVNPDLAEPGYPSTWWQQKYGTHPDPTFILPWFYDPEKGFLLSENVKRFQTHDIFFDPANPKTGDTLSITARIRNFSLIPTAGPVTVRFYVGDPDSGGTLITGINGDDSAATGTYIKARGWADAAIKWIVPGGLPMYPAIYAVIDPGNQIMEIHENNNKGFNVLGSQLITDVADHKSISSIPNSPALYQSYPNPFNPTTHIEYSIPQKVMVTLNVFNILGQKVETLVSGVEAPGKHNITFDGSRYASGVYIYRLQAGSYSFTKKMVLLK